MDFFKLAIRHLSVLLVLFYVVGACLEPDHTIEALYLITAGVWALVWISYKD